MKRESCIALVVFLATFSFLPGCISREESPIEGEWKVIEVKGANPGIFMNEVWEFTNGRYRVRGLGLSGSYELGSHGGKNTIMLFPDNEAEARGAGIYMLREYGTQLTIKLGNADNDAPDFPEDFTEDPMWYDVLVCEKQ